MANKRIPPITPTCAELVECMNTDKRFINFSLSLSIIERPKEAKLSFVEMTLKLFLTSTPLSNRLLTFFLLLLFLYFNAQSLLPQALPSGTKTKGMSIATDADIKAWQNSKRVALVVGVNGYQTLSRLNFAVGDSTKMKLSLDQVGHFDKIVLLNDEIGEKKKEFLPTKVNIEREYSNLLKEKPNMILFYFSGHGFMNNAGENIIAPIDIQYQSREKVERFVSISSLVKQSTGITQSIFLIDACREQLTKNTKSLDGEKFGKLPPDVQNAKGVGIMMGTAPGGFSYENDNLGGGIFTHFLVRALNGGVQDEGPEYVTFGKLKEYMEKHIPEYTLKEVNKKQIPYTAGDYTGNFLLAVGRPKNEIQSKITKYLDKGKNLRLSRILYDTENKRIQQNFFLLSGNGTYSMSDLDGVQKMSFDYGKDLFAARQYNLKGEVEEEFLYSATERDKVYFTYLEDNVLKNSIFTQDTNGITETISYPKQTNLNPNQVTKVIYKLNGTGEIVEISYLNAESKPTPNKQGISQIKYQYNGKGKRVLTESFNSNGNLVEDKNGIARYKYEFNDSGNKTLEEFYSAKGDLIPDKIARKKISYDNNFKDKIKSEEYLDASNKLKEDSSGIAKFIFSYDGNGNKQSEEFFDSKNELKSSGISGKKYSYDTKGNLTSEEYFNSKRKLIEDRYSGIAKYIYDYNGLGKKISEKYFDSDNKPTTDRLGIHERKFFYNEKNYLEKEEYFNKEGNLTEDKNGIVKKIFSYNPKGLKISEEYLDKNGDKKPDTTGIAKRKFTYNDSGLILTKEFFNKYETPEDDSNKISKYSYSYDEKGNLVSEENFDKNQNLVKSEYNLYYPNKLVPRSKTETLIKLDKYFRPIELKFFE